MLLLQLKSQSCYNPKLGSDCNLGKDLSKNKENDQLVVMATTNQDSQ